MSRIFFALSVVAAAIAFASCAATTDRASASSGPPLPEGEWTSYQNPRFGFVLAVPPGAEAGREPDNGAGCNYTAADGAFKISAWASFDVDSGITSLDAQWLAATTDHKRLVLYKTKGDTWFVVSGEMGGGEGFYEKTFVDGGYCAGFQVTYPQAREKEFQPWIETIAREFQPNLGQGEDKIGPAVN